MSNIFKLFKSKKSNKENRQPSPLNQESLDRSSTRSQVEGHVYQGDFSRALRDLPNPYYTWTEPKATRGPSSCPGAPIDYGSRRQRSSFYGDGASSTSRRRARSDLSTVEEFSTTSDGMRFDGSFAAEADRALLSRIDELESLVDKLRMDRKGLRRKLEKYRDDCKSYEDFIRDLQWQVDYHSKVADSYRQKLRKESEQARTFYQLFEAERDKREELEARLHGGEYDEGGAEERLCTSSETSLDEDDENFNTADELHRYHGGESSQSVTGGADQQSEQVETARDAVASRTSSPINRNVESLSASDSLLYSRRNSQRSVLYKTRYVGDRGGEDVWGGRSIAKGRVTSGSSEDETTMRLREQQLRKRGEVVKFQPPRRKIQPMHFKRFRRPEQSALQQFHFLDDIETDISGLLSSPDPNSSSQKS